MTDFHKNTQDLIREIERKDRGFRVFQAVSLTLVGLGVVALLALNYNIQRQNRDLLDRQSALTMQLKQSVADLEKNNDTKLSELQNHIDCIISLKSQPNNDSIFIQNITNCQLSSPGGATGGTKSPVKSNATQTKTPTNNNPGTKTETVKNTAATSGPVQGFLQKIMLTPIVKLVKGLF